MFQMTVDTDRALVDVLVRGLIAGDEAARYVAELNQAMVALQSASSYVMFFHVVDAPIQPQETVAMMTSQKATMRKARAIAILTGSSPVRMQIRRLFTQPYVRLVESRDEGLAWIFDGIDPSLDAVTSMAG